MKHDHPLPDNLSRENADLKPGAPPRPATEPKGAGPSMQTDKTRTDPGSGEPRPDEPD